MRGQTPNTKPLAPILLSPQPYLPLLNHNFNLIHSLILSFSSFSDPPPGRAWRPASVDTAFPRKPRGLSNTPIGPWCTSWPARAALSPSHRPEPQERPPASPEPSLRAAERPDFRAAMRAGASAGPVGLRPFPVSCFHSTFPRRWLEPASTLSAEAKVAARGANTVALGARAAGKYSSVMRLLCAESEQGSPRLSAPNIFLVHIFPTAYFLSAFPSSSLLPLPGSLTLFSLFPCLSPILETDSLQTVNVQFSFLVCVCELFFIFYF